jgi:hypothetical protein
MPEDRLSRLRLDAPRSGTVAETAAYLNALDSCYIHLATFHQWVDDIADGDWRHWAPFPLPWYPVLPDVGAPPDVPLRVSAVQLQSPGFWEFFGALLPLETLRKYLADRHDRRKDRKWRDAQEAERARLENERLRTQVVSDRVEMLRKVGVPRSIIRRALVAHVIQPLETLDVFQDSDLIGTVASEPSGASPAGPKRPRREIDVGEDDESKKDGEPDA